MLLEEVALITLPKRLAFSEPNKMSLCGQHPQPTKSPQRKKLLEIHSNTMIWESLDFKFKIQDSEPSVFSSTAPSQPRPRSSCAQNGTLHPRGPLLPSKGSQFKVFQLTQTFPNKRLDTRIYQSVWRAMSKLNGTERGLLSWSRFSSSSALLCSFSALIHCNK